MIELLGGLIVANCFLTAVVLYKLRKVHLATYRIEDIANTETKNLYKEIQAYHELVRLIRPNGPLPLLRDWAASPDFLLQVAKYVLEEKPVRILECSSGASTLVLARCCELNGVGRVYSLESERKYADVTRGELIRHGVAGFATVVDAPLIGIGTDGGAKWYALDELPHEYRNVDLLVIDGPPAGAQAMARYPALPLLIDRLAETCSIFLDDANRPGERATLEKWKREYPEFDVNIMSMEKGAAHLSRTARTV